jgi:hypothetical protein
MQEIQRPKRVSQHGLRGRSRVSFRAPYAYGRSQPVEFDGKKYTWDLKVKPSPKLRI